MQTSRPRFTAPFPVHDSLPTDADPNKDAIVRNYIENKERTKRKAAARKGPNGPRIRELEAEVRRMTRKMEGLITPNRTMYPEEQARFDELRRNIDDLKRQIRKLEGQS